jgi:hypothetical protein
MFTSTKVVKIKITGLPKEKEYAALPFGRRIEYARKIEEFKATAKTGWISQKRQTSAKAFRDFVNLNDVTQYYAEYVDDGFVRDDSYQIWYK